MNRLPKQKQKSAKEVFFNQKVTALSGVDLSRKGNIDSHVLPLVAFINQQVSRIDKKV